ncbi:hypothetical protein MGMO_138c00390 [Methyloglobulus morosus KoM1]|uniref:Uncharacterized protein n=1 Tax=Methyloglobulus morosus KoM1 TaxID=1116472 RepID=V5DP49_9GAMM|nr:hypothetical protein [Methyloglobulus morosus]ESS69201.1 hypothetical protein MGMO_138c00390 [Methyloglobulus morosus KoM1]
MIRYFIDDDQKLRLEQVEKMPTVYLDHWALRHISTTEEIRTQFIKRMFDSGGTLMLSWLNLVEFTKVTDRSQTKAAEQLVDELLPNVFFMEIEPFKVIKREDELLAGGVPKPPHADIDFLKTFDELNHNSLYPSFTAQSLFSAFHGSNIFSEFDNLADMIIGRIEAMRTEFDTDPGLQSIIRRAPKGQFIQQGTRYILRELTRTFLVDRPLKISRNNAIDLLHSVVPVAYCDFVLLDAHWTGQVDKMRTRLAKANLNIPVARVFSKKSNGLNDLLYALKENHN